MREDLILTAVLLVIRIGDLRLRLPQLIPLYNKDFQATQYGSYCPQHTCYFPGVPTRNITNESEDCLTINIIKPAGDFRENLPVVVVSNGDLQLIYLKLTICESSGPMEVDLIKGVLLST